MIDPIAIYIARLLLFLHYAILAIGCVAIHDKPREGKWNGVEMFVTALFVGTLWYIATR